METKNKTNATKKENAVKPEKSGNKTLWWILGGCLALCILIALVIGVIAFLSYKKVKKEIRENQQRFEEAQRRAESMAPGAGTGTLPAQSSIPEEPTSQNAQDSGVPSDIIPPAASEKAIGYLKKVYTKGGKNYISIDYIQWLTGSVAEQAMREDGECPKKGECIVLNDYYIRNQNPLIRTFAVSPDAEILAHDFSQTTYSSGNWNESWTFSRFSNYFNDSANNGYWDFAPFHVEIGNNQIVKITEQYIP